MSYLILKDGIPDFDKAVISFWFIVPKKSIEDVIKNAASFDGGGEFPVRPRMIRILPLLTFGPIFDGYQIKSEPTPGGNYTITYTTASNGVENFLGTEAYDYSTGPTLTEISKTEPNPSCIGVICRNDGDTGEPTAHLYIRLQMKEFGSGSWVDWVSKTTISSHTIIVANTGEPRLPDNEQAWSTSYKICLNSYASSQPRITSRSSQDESDFYRRADGPEAFEAGGLLKIEPDKWHHLLLSFDLGHTAEAQGGMVIDTYSECSPDPARGLTEPRNIIDPHRMWLALDDKNHVNGETTEEGGEPTFPLMRKFQYQFNGIGKNDIATDNQYGATFSSTGGTAYQKTWAVTGLIAITQDDINFGLPRWTCGPYQVPSSGYELGIPCVPHTVSHKHHHVELAEFQLFTGVTLDTDDETSRRAFVLSETRPDGSKVKIPAPPKDAEKLLRRRPVILLHKSSNWQEGKNTGSLGIDDDGEIIPEGQFNRTGEIKKYKPDPSLTAAAAAP